MEYSITGRSANKRPSTSVDPVSSIPMAIARTYRSMCDSLAQRYPEEVLDKKSSGKKTNKLRNQVAIFWQPWGRSWLARAGRRSAICRLLRTVQRS